MRGIFSGRSLCTQRPGLTCWFQYRRERPSSYVLKKNVLDDIGVRGELSQDWDLS